MNKVILLFIIFVSFLNIKAQEINITNVLKEIENGNLHFAETQLKQLKSKNPSDPSVVFLDAVLTKDANEAIKIFSFYLQNFPNSKFADAALFRIFSYYYALGYYKKAESYFSQLKMNFSNSPYLKVVDKNIPNVDEFDSIENQSKTIDEKPADQIDSSEKIIFTIQVGAFLNSDNAIKLSEQLNAEGFSTEIISRIIGGSSLKIVTAGNFSSEDEAKRKLELINQKFNVKGRVIIRSGQNVEN